MGIHHFFCHSELFYKMGLWDAIGTEDDQDNSKSHVDWPSKFLNVDQSIPTTENLSRRSLDIPDCER
jgi:hypothetical protein